MRKTSAGLLSLALAAGLGASFGPPAVSAPPWTAPERGADARTAAGGHEKVNPLEAKRRALREEALTAVLNGDAKVMHRGPSTVVKVGSADTASTVNSRGRQTSTSSSEPQYVELSRETTDRVFVVLAEFGNQRHPKFPDKDLEPSIEGPATFEGPRHNAIPKPNRNQDNATVWEPNFDRDYFQKLYFGNGGAPGAGRAQESVKQYYQRQSSGRYSISGTVTDWVKVRFNEARYGRSSDDPRTGGNDRAVCADVVCVNTWALVRDSVNKWTRDQRAQGKSEAQIRAELATYDRWDRYDHDNDGDFNERDGYIDHFQVVHAGGDEADGDPNQGEDAIWSHRWFAYQGDRGTMGPSGNLDGGTQIGDTGMWVGDYTMQSENGGMSTVAHEYAHDLGLPDLYDTAGGSNSVEWWSMMAQSRSSGPDDEGISTRGNDLGAWEKLLLGWLDYELVDSEQDRSLKLGPHEYNSANPQAAIVRLPKKPVKTNLVPPYAGQKSWWSGSGDDLDNTMTREVTLPAGTSTLSMRARWDIEDCGATPCDYAYVEVDNGAGWKAIPGSITKASEGNGIDGTKKTWTPATFNLSAYAGKTIGLRVRYLTDGAVAGMGFFADDIKVTGGGNTLFTSGAESSPEGWTLDGFGSQGASMTNLHDNYYIASHRDYVSFDKYLKSGPYNFGFANTRPNWVEHFPYQDGLLVSYWDTSFADNNTSEHPGGGEILPVDANPAPLPQPGKGYWRTRVAGYDAPFSKEKSDSITLHLNGKQDRIRGRAAQPLFQDNWKYWYAQTPEANVKVPNSGVNMRVVQQQGNTMDLRIWNRR